MTHQTCIALAFALSLLSPVSADAQRSTADKGRTRVRAAVTAALAHARDLGVSFTNLEVAVSQTQDSTVTVELQSISTASPRSSKPVAQIAYSPLMVLDDGLMASIRSRVASARTMREESAAAIAVGELASRVLLTEGKTRFEIRGVRRDERIEPYWTVNLFDVPYRPGGMWTIGLSKDFQIHSVSGGL